MMLELQIVKIPETNKVIINYLTHDSKYVLYFYQVWLHCKEMQSCEDYFEFLYSFSNKFISTLTNSENEICTFIIKYKNKLVLKPF